MFKFDYSLKKRLRTRWTTGDIDVDRKKFVGSKDDAVLTLEGKWPSGNGAVAERHYPFGLGHLIVESFDTGHHFFGDGAGNDHDITLSGRGAKYFSSEAGHIKSGTSGRHHFYGTTGYTKRQGPQGVCPADIDQFVYRQRIELPPKVCFAFPLKYSLDPCINYCE